MKIFFFICSLFVSYSSLYSKEFEFTPIKYNFNGIVNSNDTIIAYGQYANMLISYNQGTTWQKVNNGMKGNIINVFFENGHITAVTDIGEFSQSSDGGKNWQLVAHIKNDVILYEVINYHSGYLARGANKILHFTNDFKIVNEYPLLSKEARLNIYLYTDKYEQSIAYFKNQFIVCDGASEILFFDLNLNYLKKIDLNTAEVPDRNDTINDSHNYKINIFKDSVYIYLSPKTYSTQDFISFIKKEKSFAYADGFKVINESMFKMYNVSRSFWSDWRLGIINFEADGNRIDLFSLNPRNLFTQDKSIKPIDFTIIEDRAFIVANQNFLAWCRLGDSTLNIISDASGVSKYTEPDKYNESSYFFYTREQGEAYRPYFYRTENNGMTFQQAVDSDIEPNYRNFTTTHKAFSSNPEVFALKYEEESKELIFFGHSALYHQNGLWRSKDFGKSFTWDSLNIFMMDDIALPFKSKNNIVSYGDYVYFKDKHWSLIRTFNLQENTQIKLQRDSNQILHYYDSPDTSIYLQVVSLSPNNTLQIKYTSNSGASWDIIKTYSNSEAYLYHKELEFNGRRILALLSSNFDKITNSIDIIDLESRELTTFYTYKIKELELADEVYFNGIAALNDKLYLAVYDSLFIITDFKKTSTWEQYLFPNNGHVIQSFKVFEDRIFARYASDSLADNIYWISLPNATNQTGARISCTDVYFATSQIDSNTYDLAYIYNDSKEELIINGMEIQGGEEFSTDLEEISESKPLILQPNSIREIRLSFTPTDTLLKHASIVLHSNAKIGKNVINLYGKGNGTITSVDIETIENQPYLYSFPAYPQPSKEQVTSKIYWASSQKLNENNISIIDMMGNTISNKENIQLNYINSYSGYVVWNCSNVPSGIYFIKITLGNSSRLEKVLKD